LTAERWAQIEDLFHRAAECDATRRTALLDEACTGDLELRREVEELLSYEANARDHVQAAIDSQIDDFGFSMVGEVVSHYRILGALGGGGMGLVYTAEDLRLGRRVALKFLPEGSADDPSALARFEREARAASALEHPNICPIHEFGEHDGQPFLVMQLLEGQTLRELLSATHHAKPPLELPKLLDLALQTAEGLDAAHRHGIIHRDIKPANIYVTTQGQAKILDFGLAKLSTGETQDEVSERPKQNFIKTNIDRPESAALATPDPFHSRTGVAMGTAGYMSPEQARGEKLDVRTDVFSLGLVLYEMATGHRAFEGETGPELHNAILTQALVPARQLNPQVPARFAQIIAKATEKNRDARYQTVAVMQADLATLKQRIERRNPLRRWALATGFAAILIASTILWFAGRRFWFPMTRPDVKLRQLTLNSPENPVKGGAISPDGKYLAYADLKGMHIKLVGSEASQSIPMPEALGNSKIVWDVNAWLPGSDRFVANAHPATEDVPARSSQTSSIWMFSAAGGEPRKLRDIARAWSVSPDGSSIFFGTNKGPLGEREVWVMDANGERARKLYEADEKTAINWLSWSPDEQRYIYFATDDSGDTMLSRDSKGGPPTILLPPSETEKMNDIVWLPDGRLVYTLPESEALNNSCNYWTVRIDLRTGKRIDEPRRVTNLAGLCMSGGTSTSDSKRLAFLGWSPGFGTAYVADLDAGGTHIRNSRRFTLQEDDEFIGDWTPDSSTVIMGANRGDHYALYKQSLNSDSPEPIAPSVAGGLLTEAILSPDGKWVIAGIWPVSPGQIAGPLNNQTLPLVRIPIAGGAPEPILQMANPGPVSCAKAPSHLCVIAEQTADHKQMVVTAFDAVKGRGAELSRVDLDRYIDPMVDNIFCVVSPDGTRLAVTHSPDGPIEIHSLRGQPTKVIHARGLDKLFSIEWAADGMALFVARHVPDGTELLHVDERGNTTGLWKSLGPKCGAVPSPDGRHLAIYDWKRSQNMWMIENF